MSELDETLRASTSSVTQPSLDAAQPTGARLARGVALERGAVVGRYVVLSRLGAGAMGVVFAAYDPELDRKVALKLLLPRGRDPTLARARLQREAQALAKLTHPNVVAVHDVGVHGGQLFVGMEFVAGQTLGAWMAATDGPRPWKEILQVFSAAGRGLVAAHAAGLVHRDFKPDNVMLGDDGRVRVMDFGLARGEAVTDDEPEVTAGAPPERTDSLTQTGALIGTPAYMSLELLSGEPADARSDQFAFCVALWEALHGERPFEGGAIGALLDAVAGEKVREPPRGTKVPTWVRAVVRRGLSAEPDRRWPSMEALIGALADDPAVRRRKWWAAAAVVGVLVGATWGVWHAVDRDAKTCAAIVMEQHLAGVWDDSRRAEV